MAAKFGPCGEKIGPRVGSVEWQARQLSSRWQETQVRMLRLAASEWLAARGIDSTSPDASRAHPGGWKLLEPGAGAERVVRPPAGDPPLGVGRHARALVAADAERLRAVARRAIGHVAARVDRVQRHVVDGVNVGRLHHAAVAVDAVVALVAAQAVALLAPGRGVVAPERRPVRVEPRSDPDGTSGPLPPAAVVAALASFVFIRPSGSARWQAVQRAVACLPSWQPRQLAIIGRSARVTIPCVAGVDVAGGARDAARRRAAGG